MAGLLIVYGALVLFFVLAMIIIRWVYGKDYGECFADESFIPSSPVSVLILALLWPLITMWAFGCIIFTILGGTDEKLS